MIKKPATLDPTETLFFSTLLTLAGGIMDAYSYIVRGSVFATGQTGNLVLFAIHLIDGNVQKTIAPLISILAFWIGNYAAWHIYNAHFRDRALFWRRAILAIEGMILIIIGFIAPGCPHVLANLMVSFAASLQYCAFRTFHGRESYASVFCTGNMRSCADHFYKGLALGDRQSLKLALQYSCIILAFASGAIIGALAASLLREKAIWSASLLLFALLAFSFLSRNPWARLRLSRLGL